MNNIRRGEASGQAKLKDDDIRAIRALYPRNTYQQLAEAFGVSNVAIGKIITRKTWRHIP